MNDLNKYNNLSLLDINKAWCDCCIDGNLILLQYLEQSNNIINKPVSIYYCDFKYFWIHDHSGIQNAVKHGHNHIIEHILSTPIYKEKFLTDIKTLNGLFYHLPA